MRAGPQPRRPFWLPASTYYVLAVGVAVAFFFLFWGVLHDAGEETPWVTAGVSASMLLCGAAVLREIILRRARHRLLGQQRRMRSSVANFADPLDSRHPDKLTLEKNAAVL